MKEHYITFNSNSVHLEGLICLQSEAQGVVVTHPHSLYGGTMHNPVVRTLVHTFQAKGFTTLRFNFRGVGESGGRYEQGNGEKQDIESALRYVHSRVKNDIVLAGYSFGAWVNAQVTIRDVLVSSIIMVSPPVALLDFSFLSFDPRITAVVTGRRDDIAPPEQIIKLITTWNPALLFEVIEGADHFYSGKTDGLNSFLSRLIL